ncbi:MAG: hypothetical protein HS129_15175 [Leptospiraceae bacterium]|nr:hypothetical protein [Leptospiraceae bacterium]
MSPIAIRRKIEDFYGTLTKFSDEFDLNYSQLSDTIHNRRRDKKCVSALNKIGIVLPRRDSKRVAA